MAHLKAAVFQVSAIQHRHGIFKFPASPRPFGLGQVGQVFPIVTNERIARHCIVVLKLAFGHVGERFLSGFVDKTDVAVTALKIKGLVEPLEVALAQFGSPARALLAQHGGVVRLLRRGHVFQHVGDVDAVLWIAKNQVGAVGGALSLLGGAAVFIFQQRKGRRNNLRIVQGGQQFAQRAVQHFLVGRIVRTQVSNHLLPGCPGGSAHTSDGEFDGPQQVHLL